MVLGFESILSNIKDDGKSLLCKIFRGVKVNFRIDNFFKVFCTVEFFVIFCVVDKDISGFY